MVKAIVIDHLPVKGPLFEKLPHSIGILMRTFGRRTGFHQAPLSGFVLFNKQIGQILAVRLAMAFQKS